MTTIEDIKAHNARVGYHWFEPDTLRFFKSRVSSTVYEGPGGVYFVSSEQFTSPMSGYTAERRYTVRKYDPETGDIKTHGAFNEMTRSEAHTAAKKAAEGTEH